MQTFLDHPLSNLFPVFIAKQRQAINNTKVGCVCSKVPHPLDLHLYGLALAALFSAASCPSHACVSRAWTLSWV